MKCKNRAMMRRQKLDADCYKAHISKYEYGKNDNRNFCYGLVDRMTDEYLHKCKICGAFVQNAKPIESEVEE